MRALPLLLLAIFAALIPRPALAAWPEDPAWNVALCTAPNGQQFPAATSDGAGGAIVVWWDLRSGLYFDLYAQHVLASGSVDPAWPANGRALCTAPADQEYPAIVSDGAGGAIVAWCDGRGGLFDVYAQHVLASGAVDPAWPANGRAVCAQPGGQWFPILVSDGAGGAIVAWNDTRDGDMDVYAHHVLASGALDPAWPSGGLAVCALPGDQEDVRLVRDAGAGAILTWADARGGPNFDVYAHHVLANGALDPAWPADGRAICTATSNQLHPELVGDGAGGAIVAWQDVRSGAEYDLYAARVLASGVPDPAWPADGRALCTASLDQTEARVTGDGAGGAIVAWTDNRNGWDSDVYAQRVLATGVVDPAWPANGRAVCALPGFQHSPGLVSDGASGAVLLWSDNRGGANDDVYAQHLLASGALDPAWPAGGRPVSTADGDQANPVIVPGLAGSPPIAVWDDLRSGNFDIYAQAAGPTPPPNPESPAIVSVRDVKPDQGGAVAVTWTASGLDVAPLPGIADYRVWRSAPSSGWTVVGAVPASAGPTYSLTVPTTADSTGAGVPMQHFVIEARTDTAGPAEHFFSAADSGWSADDLPPSVPPAFWGVYSAGRTWTHWTASPEPDVAFYRLHRGLDFAFVPSPGNLVAEPASTSYLDAAGSPFVYKLCAVDTHGNESGFATYLPDNTASTDGVAARAYLELAGANPGGGAVALRFGLAAAGRVSLAVFDAGGRRVRTLASGAREPGAYALAWDGRDDGGRAVAPGLYFARLESPGFTATRRIVRTD